MRKIRRVETWTEDVELRRPYRIATGDISRVVMFFVRIEDEGGAVGLGAGTPSPRVTGETREIADAALAVLPDLLAGADPRHLRGLLRRLEEHAPSAPAVRAAADGALHDLAARRLGLPLVDLLGRAHDSLPTSITLGIRTAAETVEEARAHLGQGFRILKLKIGDEPERDLETLALLRQAVGEEVLIRVDANQGYTPGALATFLERATGVELVEQPMPPGQEGALRGLDAAVRRRCAADESLCSPADALRLAAEPQPFGIFNIKLMKAGGIAPALGIAEIARLAGIELMWGCMDESVISIAAALHAALASPATRYLDLDGSLDLAHDPAGGGFRLVEGRLHTLELPGLGVELSGAAR